MRKIDRRTNRKWTVACSVIFVAALAMPVAAGTGSAVGQAAVPVPDQAAQPVVPSVSNSAIKAEVRASEQSVVLSWQGQGSDYLVIDDRSNRVVWRENSTTAHIPLAYSSSVDLIVIEMTVRGAKAVAEILATNPEPASDLSPLTSVTTVDGTSVTWGVIDGVTSYQVTSGEPNSSQKLGDIAGQEVNVPTVLGQSGRYEFMSNPVHKIVAGRADESAPVTYRYGIEIVPLGISDMRIPPTVKVGEAVPRTLAGKKIVVSTENSYETFIPDKYIDAPEDRFGIRCEGGSEIDWWYSGDGRGVASHSAEYRTEASAHMVWSTQKSEPFKTVRPTSRYERKNNGEFVYDSTRTASSDSFHLRMLSNDGQYARNVIEHDVGNPYCNSVAGITYHNQQDVYQNGGHWIYGTHDKMPDHQFYRYDYFRKGPYHPIPTGEEITLIFHHKMQDPVCLVGPACSTWRYQYVR